MFEKILLAYDGSAGAKDAAQVAAQIAREQKAQVTVLTIGGPLLGASFDPQTVAVHMNQTEYERIADEGLAILAEQQIQAHKQFQWLDPADQILRTAQEGNFDLIVMGHRSARNSLRRDAGMLGSVAVKVINNAFCSVLVVRPKQSDPLAEIELEELKKVNSR